MAYQSTDQVVSPALPRISLIPGMSMEEQDDEEKRDFKPWEEWESGGRLDNVFSWKVPKSLKLSDAEKAERRAESRRLRKERKGEGSEAKAVGKAEEVAGKKDQSNKGTIPKTVWKILLRKKKGSNSGATKRGVKESTTVK